MRKYKFKYLITSAVIIVVIWGCNSRDKTQDIMSWNMVTGNWESYKGVGFNENWKKIDDSTYSGIGFSLNDADTMFMEKLELTSRNNDTYYTVYLSNDSEPVNFRLISCNGYDSWIFENFNNDFPQRIKYNLDNDTTLTITISDSAENRKQVFYMAREE